MKNNQKHVTIILSLSVVLVVTSGTIATPVRHAFNAMKNASALRMGATRFVAVPIKNMATLTVQQPTLDDKSVAQKVAEAIALQYNLADFNKAAELKYAYTWNELNKLAGSLGSHSESALSQMHTKVMETMNADRQGYENSDIPSKIKRMNVSYGMLMTGAGILGFLPLSVPVSLLAVMESGPQALCAPAMFIGLPLYALYTAKMKGETLTHLEHRYQITQGANPKDVQKAELLRLLVNQAKLKRDK